MLNITYRVLWLLLAAVVLVAAGMKLSDNFLTPLAGGSSLETLMPAKNSVAWNVHYYNPPSHYAKLDLGSGRVSIQPLATIAMLRENGRGQLISQWNGIGVHDAKSGELLWRDKDLSGFGLLVGQRYMIKQTIGRLDIIDLLPVFESPTTHGKFQGARWSIDVPGLVETNAWYVSPNVQPIDGTNRFFTVSQELPLVVRVFEIDGEQVLPVVSWPFGGGPLVVHNQKVYSSASGNREVEVRALSDFEIVDRRPFPASLARWTDVSVQRDLFCFSDAKRGTDVVHRLETFEAVPELNLPPLHGHMVDDQRYHLLADGLQYPTNRLVVYDSIAERIVYDDHPPRGLVDLGVVDGRLVRITEAMGLTVDWVSLDSGQVTRMLRPFVWQLWLVPLLWLLAIVWLIAWKTTTAELRIPAFFNVCFVTLLCALPMVYRVYSVNYWQNLCRPAVDVLLALVVSLTFCQAMYAACGLQRPLLRWSVFSLWLSGIVLLARFAGKLQIQTYYQLFTLDGMLRTLIVFALMSLVMLYLVRWVRRLAARPSAQPRATIQISDILLFTGCVAIFLFAATPYRQVNWMRERGALVNAAQGLLACMLGLVGLVRSPKVYRMAVMIGMVLGCAVVVAATLRMAMGHHARELVFTLTGDLLRLLGISLASFVSCALLNVTNTGLSTQPRPAEYLDGTR